MNFHVNTASLISCKYHGDVAAKIYYKFMHFLCQKIIFYSYNTNGSES